MTSPHSIKKYINTIILAILAIILVVLSYLTYILVGGLYPLTILNNLQAKCIYTDNKTILYLYYVRGVQTLIPVPPETIEVTIILPDGITKTIMVESYKQKEVEFDKVYSYIRLIVVGNDKIIYCYRA